ncbi:divalent-cation tolerance protein CutA [Anopheles arabiensis]|uniref:Uncharacterized protein n=1 Tax=Anopheles arabiensis TaxID=7173 RepID=A0A182I9X6_ANOAR|nr:divalent-cation tolerance protein CutA [Anopheles arabiensis]
MLRPLALLPSCILRRTTASASARRNTMATDGSSGSTAPTTTPTATGNEYSVAFVTTPDSAVATKLARQLVERKLVACVNIIPGLTSIYSWEDKINEDPEVLMMLKTRTDRVEEVIRFVRESHPYSVAEVIAMPMAAGNPPYLDWIGKTVPKRDG